MRSPQSIFRFARRRSIETHQDDSDALNKRTILSSMNVILSERQSFQSAIDQQASRGEKLSDPDGKQTRFFESSLVFSI
jgi:hypothetical protein